MWLDNHLLQRLLVSDLWIHSATSTEARNRGGAILGKIQGGPSCLMAWAPINCMGGQQVFKILYSQKCYWLGQKASLLRQNEGKLLDFWDSTGWANRAIRLQIYMILQEKRGMTLKVVERSAGYHYYCGHRGPVDRAVLSFSRFQRSQSQWPGLRVWGCHPGGPEREAHPGRHREQRMIIKT